MSTDNDELRALIEDSAQKIFSENVSRALLEAAEDGSFSQSLWQLSRDAGFALTPVPEKNGGVGGSWRDAWPVLQAVGQWSVPLPIAETMIAASLLACAGIALPADGEPMTVVESDLKSPLRIEGEGKSARLSGAATLVPWARHCRHAVVVIGEGTVGSDLTVALVDLKQGAAVQCTANGNVALEPRDDLVFTSALCQRAGIGGGIGLARPVLQLGALARAAMISGSLQRVLQMTVQYAGERVQFGKPIGKNQAIQQPLASLAGEAGAAQTAARIALDSWADAADLVARGAPVPQALSTQVAFDIAVAKLRASQAVGLATSVVHQTHGAIGFTYEHMLHFSTRRLWAWRGDYGSASWWAQRLGRAAIAAGKDGFWPALTARSMNPL